MPILTAPYFDHEVIGPEMLDRLGDELFAEGSAEAILYDELSQELVSDNGSARLRLALPFATEGEITLKKIGLEVIVRVGGQKRTIILPPALTAYRPSAARFEDGTLEVSFEKPDERTTSDSPT